MEKPEGDKAGVSGRWIRNK